MTKNGDHFILELLYLLTLGAVIAAYSWTDV
jgi:hypothetical protein